LRPENKGGGLRRGSYRATLGWMLKAGRTVKGKETVYTRRPTVIGGEREKGFWGEEGPFFHAIRKREASTSGRKEWRRGRGGGVSWERFSGCIGGGKGEIEKTVSSVRVTEDPEPCSAGEKTAVRKKGGCGTLSSTPKWRKGRNGRKKDLAPEIEITIGP